MPSLAEINIGDNVVLQGYDERQNTAQNISRAINGIAIIEEASVSGGIPFTVYCGWITYSTLQSLIAQSAIPGTKILSLTDRTITCRFHHDQSPFEVEPVFKKSQYSSDDLFDVTVKLIG